MTEAEQIEKQIIGWDGARLFVLPHPFLHPFIAHYTFLLSDFTGVAGISGSMGRDGLSGPMNFAVKGAPDSQAVFAAKDESSGNRKKPGMLRIIPDASGCVVFERDSSGICGSFWGATTKVVEVNDDPENQPLYVFAEFLPGGAGRFMDAGQEAFVDQRLSLEDIWPGLFREFSDLLFEQMPGAVDVPLMTAKLDAFFLRRLGSCSGEERIRGAFRLLEAYEGALSVGEAADLTGYSTRQLGRLSRQILGVNTKAYFRLLRINRVVERVRERSLPLTVIAQEAGYFDQAHFIHDFHAVCGVSPKEYLEQMSVFYNELYKF